MKARASEVFVGRLRELEELERALDASRTGSGATVLVAGEAGIGKTRLVSELESRAHDAGFEVLVGRAIDLVGTELPYQPFVDSLRPLGDPRQVDEQKAGSQLHVFENTLALLTDRAAAAPVLLVLEDLHWADTSTLDLVVFLAATSPTVGCCCSLLRSMSTNGPWRSTRHEWEREPGRTYPLTLRFVVERVTGIEPALSAWELDCHASADQHVAGQSLCPVVHEYPLSTDRTHRSGTQRARSRLATFGDSSSHGFLHRAWSRACCLYGPLTQGAPRIRTSGSRFLPHRRHVCVLGGGPPRGRSHRS